MAGKERSHVHLCLTDYRDGTYTVHHIDIAPLFLDDDDDPHQLELDPGAMKEAVLPPPATRLATSPETNALAFHLLRRAGDDDKIVATDEQCRTLIYDVVSGAVSPGHMLLSRKCNPVSAAVGDRLYVLDNSNARCRSTCLEALVYDDEDPRCADLYWRPIPGPPYAGDDNGRPLPYSRVTALAVVGTSIWTTTHAAEGGGVVFILRFDPESGVWRSKDDDYNGDGTYSFDTERQAWRKEGIWDLPFAGKAEFVPGCNLWFGFSRADGSLCAADLATTPHRACGVWEDFRPPKDWFACTRHLVNLGFGKLCVIRFFATDPAEKWWGKDPVAIITAMEVRPMPCHDDDNHHGIGGRIKMVKHMSRCIKLPNYNRGTKYVL